MIKSTALSVLAIIIATSVAAQRIPADKQVTWAGAGIPANNPVITNEVNILNFGGVGDSTTDNAPAIDSAMSSFHGRAGIVYFPPGKYYIESTLNMPDSVTLRGDCSDSSYFIFNLWGAAIDCIDAQIVNEPDTFKSIVVGFSKDTNVITVGDITGFTVGGYAEIQETNGAWDVVPATWATGCVGQIVHITAINGNNITFDNPLRIGYTPSLNPQIRPWTSRKFVGIEDLNITRVDTGLPATGYCIYFSNALNCWVKGVQSSHSVGAHVAMNVSTNITVSGCYFHDSYAYDGVGTRGYGVLMIQHSGQNLVENNVFDHLRHSIINKQGANGNVAGYNYAVNEYRVETPTNAGADLVLHGHYPFANLYEGNIASNIMIDSTWGPAGPYNTFYRNRANLYGVLMTPGPSVLSDSENFVGNETTDAALFFGIFYFVGNNHFLYGNDSLGVITPAGTNNLADTSYYRTSFTDFWNTNPLPPTIGMPIPLGTGTIPAADRYAAGGRITVSPNPACRVTTRIPKISSRDFSVYPNPASDFIYVKLGNTNAASTLQLLSVDGRVIYQSSIAKGTTETQINIRNYPEGLYLIRLSNENSTFVRKVAIER